MPAESAIVGFMTGILSIGAVVKLSVAEVTEEPWQASNALNISISIIAADKFFLLIMIIHLSLQFLNTFNCFI